MDRLPEAVDELSVYVLPGRVTNPAVGLGEAQDAERAGFSRVWISERFDLKDIGVLSGALGVATTRIGLGTALVVVPARHPIVLASYCATMQTMFGSRLVLGIGRGVPQMYEPQGMPSVGLDTVEDYVTILRRLWAGETVTYTGPAGQFPNMKMVDPLQAQPPPVYYGAFGNPQALEMVARSLDGVILMPFLTVDSVAEAGAYLRKAAERAGRDPADIRVVHTLVTAPDLSEDQVLSVVHARALTYLQMQGFGEALVRRNHWDPAQLAPAREHQLFQGMRTASADQNYHRAQIIEAARLLPDEWMRSSAGIGTPEEIAARLQEYFDVGVDEICLHGSSPAQNAPVLAAWRRRRATVSS